MAQYDETSIVVYQAYAPEIADFATQAGFFGGAFRFSRMSWIKPNFLWMMYRSGWAGKTGQERVLAIHIHRAGFDHILKHAVHSTFIPAVYGSHEQWQAQVKASTVRLQWDPDHAPNGQALARRAIQLGLSGQTLQQYGKQGGYIQHIEDITPFVHAQATHLQAGNIDALITPTERPYPVTDAAVHAKLQLDQFTTLE